MNQTTETIATQDMSLARLGRRRERTCRVGGVHYMQHMFGRPSLQQTSTYLNATLAAFMNRCALSINPARLQTNRSAAYGLFAGRLPH